MRSALGIPTLGTGSTTAVDGGAGCGAETPGVRCRACSWPAQQLSAACWSGQPRWSARLQHSRRPWAEASHPAQLAGVATLPLKSASNTVARILRTPSFCVRLTRCGQPACPRHRYPVFNDEALLSVPDAISHRSGCTPRRRFSFPHSNSRVQYEERHRARPIHSPRALHLCQRGCDRVLSSRRRGNRRLPRAANLDYAVQRDVFENFELSHCEYPWLFLLQPLETRGSTRSTSRWPSWRIRSIRSGPAWRRPRDLGIQIRLSGANLAICCPRPLRSRGAASAVSTPRRCSPRGCHHICQSAE